MSFKINWPDFSDEFIESAKVQLTLALNSGPKPSSISGDILVTGLKMGTKPPELEILEITELLPDRFKGIFKFLYNGDATLILRTNVQANPLSTAPVARTLNTRRGMLLADKPLIVPMEMRISKLNLRGIVVLVVDKEKGITLVFKNDPLDAVHVSSTFDNVPNIRQLLQIQIEDQLRTLFQQELPQMIHNLSLLLLKKSQSKDDSSDADQPETVSEDTPQPHRRKWTGNNPIGYQDNEVFNDGSDLFLYKSLSSQNLVDEGLRVVEQTPKKSKQSSTSISSSIKTKLSGINGAEPKPAFYPAYFQPGLPQKPRQPSIRVNDQVFTDDMNNYLYRVQNFLDSSDSFHSLEYFNQEDSKSTQTAPGRLGPPSPPASLHKGQLAEGLYWQRPSATSTIRPIRSRSNTAVEVPLQTKDRVILSPSDNELTAHLANLMQTHLTISPNTQPMKYFAFRGALNVKEDYETKSLPEMVRTASARKSSKRRVHRIKVPANIVKSRNSDGSLAS